MTIDRRGGDAFLSETAVVDTKTAPKKVQIKDILGVLGYTPPQFSNHFFQYKQDHPSLMRIKILICLEKLQVFHYMRVLQ